MAAPAAPEPERELTELEGLQLKCNQVTMGGFVIVRSQSETVSKK